MNDQASQPSAPQPAAQVPQPEPPKRRHVALGCGGCATVLVVLLIAGGGCRRNPDFPAIYAASNEVEKHVVAPESVKFDRNDCKIAARHSDGVTVIVYVPFSSKNRFGVVLPGYMLGVVSKLGETSLVIEEEIFDRSPTVNDLKNLTKKMGGSWKLEAWAQ